MPMGMVFVTRLTIVSTGLRGIVAAPTGRHAISVYLLEMMMEAVLTQVMFACRIQEATITSILLPVVAEQHPL